MPDTGNTCINVTAKAQSQTPAPQVLGDSKGKAPDTSYTGIGVTVKAKRQTPATQALVSL